MLPDKRQWLLIGAAITLGIGIALYALALATEPSPKLLEIITADIGPLRKPPKVNVDT